MSLPHSIENQNFNKVDSLFRKVIAAFEGGDAPFFSLSLSTFLVSFTFLLTLHTSLSSFAISTLTVLTWTSSVALIYLSTKLGLHFLLGSRVFYEQSKRFLFIFLSIFVAFLLTQLMVQNYVYEPILKYTSPLSRGDYFHFFSPLLIYSLILAAILYRMKNVSSDQEDVKKSDATFSRFFDDEKTEKVTLISTALILGPGMVFLLHQNPYWPATLQSQLTIVVYLSTLFLFFNLYELGVTQVATLVMGRKPAPNFLLEYCKFFLTFISTSFMMYALVYIPIFHYNPNLSVGMFITPPAIYSFLAAAIFHRFKQMKDIALKSKVAQAEAQYSLLESQMQPHFLFNSLNVLSELIYVDPDLANSMAQKMADLYREILNNSKNNFSNLESEISILKKYVEIQKIRFGDRIDFSVDVSPAFYNLQIPSLMLQTLVENAIKHGISPKQEGGEISLSVTKQGNMFEVCISNTGNLYKGHQDSKRSTGLQNTKNRLELAYGSKNSFQIYSDNKRTYVKFFITGRTP